MHLSALKIQSLYKGDDTSAFINGEELPCFSFNNCILKGIVHLLREEVHTYVHTVEMDGIASALHISWMLQYHTDNIPVEYMSSLSLLTFHSVRVHHCMPFTSSHPASLITPHSTHSTLLPHQCLLLSLSKPSQWHAYSLSHSWCTLVEQTQGNCHLGLRLSVQWQQWNYAA